MLHIQYILKEGTSQQGVKQSGFVWNLKQTRILWKFSTHNLWQRILWVRQAHRGVSIFCADTYSRGIKRIFFFLEFYLKYLGFILEHTNQGHNGVIYHLFTAEILLCHAPTVVQPGNSANTPSRRDASIRAFIIPFCDLQNWFFTKIPDTDNQWQLMAHHISGTNNDIFVKRRQIWCWSLRSWNERSLQRQSHPIPSLCYQEIPHIITLVTRT